MLTLKKIVLILSFKTIFLNFNSKNERRRKNVSPDTAGWGREEHEEKRITKGHKEILGSDDYVHYFYCSDGFSGVCLCQNFTLYN